MKMLCYLSLLPLLLLLSGCETGTEDSPTRPKQKEPAVVPSIPLGGWAPEQVYVLRRRGYITDSRGYVDLKNPAIFTGLAKYERNPSGSKGYFVGVAEIGDRFRVVRLENSTWGIGVEAIFETGRHAGKKVFVQGFGERDIVIGDFGMVFPPDPNYVRKIR